MNSASNTKKTKTSTIHPLDVYVISLRVCGDLHHPRTDYTEQIEFDRNSSIECAKDLLFEAVKPCWERAGLQTSHGEWTRDRASCCEVVDGLEGVSFLVRVWSSLGEKIFTLPMGCGRDETDGERNCADDDLDPDGDEMRRRLQMRYKQQQCLRTWALVNRFRMPGRTLPLPIEQYVGRLALESWSVLPITFGPWDGPAEDIFLVAVYGIPCSYDIDSLVDYRVCFGHVDEAICKAKTMLVEMGNRLSSGLDFSEVLSFCESALTEWNEQHVHEFTWSILRDVWVGDSSVGESLFS